ncbi:hypothetical protein HGRIS_003101 [Hohenbuehelia grisea]|uniref:Uncharacterized protein n=1 Tax=Hohenbuehelia grisea TaxID=104357 RepID=A0ABR3JNF9_9AGAR
MTMPGILEQTGNMDDFAEVLKLATNGGTYTYKSAHPGFTRTRKEDAYHFFSRICPLPRQLRRIASSYYLEACVNLQSLFISGPDPTGSVVPHGPPVILKKLINFCISGQREVTNDIVPRITAPSLRGLKLHPWPILRDAVHDDTLLRFIRRSNCKLESLNVHASVENKLFLELLSLISATIVNFMICFYPFIRPDILEVFTPDPGSTDTSKWPFPSLEWLEFHQCLQAPDGALGRMLEARCETKRMKLWLVMDKKHVDRHPKDFETIGQLESLRKLQFRLIAAESQ